MYIFLLLMLFATSMYAMEKGDNRVEQDIPIWKTLLSSKKEVKYLLALRVGEKIRDKFETYLINSDRKHIFVEVLSLSGIYGLSYRGVKVQHKPSDPLLKLRAQGLCYPQGLACLAYAIADFEIYAQEIREDSPDQFPHFLATWRDDIELFRHAMRYHDFMPLGDEESSSLDREPLFVLGKSRRTWKEFTWKEWDQGRKDLVGEPSGFEVIRKELITAKGLDWRDDNTYVVIDPESKKEK